MNQALEDYKRIADGLGLAELEETRVQITNGNTPDHAELLRVIAEFEPEQGWVTQQSCNHLFQAADLVLPEDQGYILEAEVLRADCSLRIRSNGAGGWAWTRIEQSTDEDAVPVILEPSRHLARGGKQLSYHVYWKHDSNFGWRPWTARLVSIEEDHP